MRVTKKYKNGILVSTTSGVPEQIPNDPGDGETGIDTQEGLLLVWFVCLTLYPLGTRITDVPSFIRVTPADSSGRYTQTVTVASGSLVTLMDPVSWPTILRITAAPSGTIATATSLHFNIDNAPTYGNFYVDLQNRGSFSFDMPVPAGYNCSVEFGGVATTRTVTLVVDRVSGDWKVSGYNLPMPDGCNNMDDVINILQA